MVGGDDLPLLKMGWTMDERQREPAAATVTLTPQAESAEEGTPKSREDVQSSGREERGTPRP